MCVLCVCVCVCVCVVFVLCVCVLCVCLCVCVCVCVCVVQSEIQCLSSVFCFLFCARISLILVVVCCCPCVFFLVLCSASAFFFLLSFFSSVTHLVCLCGICTALKRPLSSLICQKPARSLSLSLSMHQSVTDLSRYDRKRGYHPLCLVALWDDHDSSYSDYFDYSDCSYCSFDCDGVP